MFGNDDSDIILTAKEKADPPKMIYFKSNNKICFIDKLTLYF